MAVTECVLQEFVVFCRRTRTVPPIVKGFSLHISDTDLRRRLQLDLKIDGIVMKPGVGSSTAGSADFMLAYQ